MKKKLNIVFIILFSFIFLLPNAFKVNAQTVYKSYENINDINTIAKNFAISTIKWTDVKVYNIKSLYNFNNKLIAYSVDIRNNKNGLIGYEIISTSPKDDLILEFSKNKKSPYSTIGNKFNCIYDGFLNYYYQNKTSLKTFYNITTKRKLNKNQLNSLRDKEYISSKTNKTLKKNNTVSSAINKTQKILDDVPDELWYKGCTPTAIAMILEYDYYNYTPVYQELVEQLATAMGTDANGITYTNKVVPGIKSVMKNLGVDVFVQQDGMGKDQSTYDKYVNEINNNHPVLVTLVNSKETSYGYPQGFDNHCCAGIGYQYSDTEKFIIVHDDAEDGDVYCDFNNSALGTNCWIYIH
ncbi:C39 family peptidase [Clostridium hydrogenum]|uniref:C39 family peptidase n=1 Tax=Clostridium hydrogenum TaxID=2855764 RepID=UPI001F1EB6C7|nr:C39 family peptidase [Clostridium hydrogenum]